MEFTCSDIAQILGGKVEGNENVIVHNLSKIEEGEAGTLSFLANPKYEGYIYSTQASVVIVNDDFKPEKQLPKTLTLIRVKNAYDAFAQLLDYYNHLTNEREGIEQPSYISDGVVLGEKLYIGAFAYIGKDVKLGDGVKIYPQTFIGDRVEIGEGSVIYPGCKIYSDTKIGEKCVIHAGVVIGADGFGFAPNSENSYNKVAQIGNVVLEDHVEIGANSCIDRATLGSTIIKKGVKLDNLIQIAHNVEVGENTVMASQTGVAGSTKIGKNCMFGGQVGIIGHLQLGDRVKIAAQSGVSKSVKEDSIIQGSPAYDVREYTKSYVGFRKLPDLMKRLNEVERQLKNLETQKD
jgi:UDP-3-O-[3-hydroxymyristoyl] glucosamine N-acyltransferase